MKRFWSILVVWALWLAFIPIQRAEAQHGGENSLPLPEDAWKGQVSGKVVNATTGKTVTEAVEVMLHAWDAQDQERVMLHGNAGADGAFRFEDVDFHQSFFYSVMATYQGASYYSEPAGVQKGETALALDARVYDTTNDPASIRVAQLHVLFYIEQGQLGVTQFYALSNQGNLTVKDAVTLPRDRTGTLKFHLPDEAQNVQFGNDSTGERFVLLPGGFADTAPLPPGEGVSQVVVGYNLPYSGKLAYTYLAPVAVDGVSFLVLEGSGLTLQGEGLTPAGERSLQDGSKFNVYTAASLAPGEQIQLTLSGNPAASSAGKPAAGGLSTKGIALGLAVFGLALIGTGAWWLRRKEDVETGETGEDPQGQPVEAILDEIQALDQMYQRGEISEEEYQENRESLRSKHRKPTG